MSTEDVTSTYALKEGLPRSPALYMEVAWPIKHEHFIVLTMLGWAPPREEEDEAQNIETE